tara:strand:+ start:352 stop:675 length:324 start_codon:yes stop_codon:yes gene_type:complete
MAVTSAIAAVASVGYSIYAGQKQQQQQKKALKMQEEANQDARETAKKEADRADVEMNRANRKKADVAAIQSKEDQSALSGPAGTMLTGVQGVDPNKLKLGGNTLLGG